MSADTTEFQALAAFCKSISPKGRAMTAQDVTDAAGALVMRYEQHAYWIAVSWGMSLLHADDTDGFHDWQKVALNVATMQMQYSQGCGDLKSG
ncbi:MAG: hypothetical protein WDN01_09910 [Rhizomicrobium sp.]